jgi:septation ring formation regulator EzrA
MGSPAPGAGQAPLSTDIQQLNNYYSDLLDDLKSAYSTSDDATKDRLEPSIDGVINIISQINAVDITSRDRQYSELKVQVFSVNKNLKDLQKEIDQIRESVSIASKIISGISTVVSAAEKVFPGI